MVIAYCNIFSVFSAAEVEAGEGLQRSADALHEAYSDTVPELWEAVNGGPQYPDINISVSFDITWQKRGFTYLSGLGVCIDVLTGLVINHHVLSKYCHACEVNTKRITHMKLLVTKQHMLVTVASTTTSPSKPWSKRQEKLCGAAPSPNTVCGILRCSATVILLCTRILL